jgi:hypothetical protein
MEASKDEPEDDATEDEDTSGLETTAAESCIDDNDIDGSLAALFRAEASTNKQMAIDKENPGAQNPLQCDPMLFNLLVAVARSAMTTFRFGKHVDVSFTKLGKLSGASIETHLLEKVRLNSPLSGRTEPQCSLSISQERDGSRATRILHWQQVLPRLSSPQ